MATRARARYEITADDKTARALRTINRNVRGVHDSFISLRSVVIGLAGAGGFGLLIDRSLETADAIGKQADAVGLTTDQYQELVFIVDKAGISQSQFTSNMTAFVKRVGEAREGVGPLTSFMRKYDEEVLRNIVNSGSQAEALDIVVEAIRNATDAADRAAIANAAFSRSGIGMVNALRGGSDALEEMRQRARDLGLIIDESLIRDAERAGDQLATLSDILRIKLTAAIVEAAPQIEALAEGFIAALQAVTEFFDYINGNVSEIDVLKDEIHLLELQVANTAQEFQDYNKLGRIGEFIKGQLGLETPEELEAQLDELNQIVFQKRQELLQLMRPPEPAEAAPAAPSAPGASGTDGDEERQREALERRLEIVGQGFLSEEELARQHFENQALIIEEAFSERIIPTEQAFKQLRAQNEAQFQNQLASIEKKGLTQRQKFLQASMVSQVKTIAGELHNATAAVAQENEVMFRLNQAAGIANVIVTTIQGINRAFADFPYPIALGISAAIAAGGAVNLAAIASQSIGGGKAAPSFAAQGAVSGPVPTFDANAGVAGGETQSVQQVSITLNGTGYSKQDVRDLIESINEEIGDGVALETT